MVDSHKNKINEAYEATKALAQDTINSVRPHAERVYNKANLVLSDAAEAARPYSEKVTEYTLHAKETIDRTIQIAEDKMTEASQMAKSYFIPEASEAEEKEEDDLEQIKEEIQKLCLPTTLPENLDKYLESLTKAGKHELIKEALNKRHNSQHSMIEELSEFELTSTERLAVLIKYGADPNLALKSIASKKLPLTEIDLKKASFLFCSSENFNDQEFIHKILIASIKFNILPLTETLLNKGANINFSETDTPLKALILNIRENPKTKEYSRSLIKDIIIRGAAKKQIEDDLGSAKTIISKKDLILLEKELDIAIKSLRSERSIVDSLKRISSVSKDPKDYVIDRLGAAKKALEEKKFLSIF